MIDIHLMVSRHSVFYSPFIATITGGFLEKEGLRGHYEVVSPAKPLIAEIVSQRIHVGQAAVSFSWAELEKGGIPSLAQFAQINTRDGFLIAARTPDTDFDWQQLKKGKFMYVHGGQPEAMLRYAAHKMGVDLDEVQGIDRAATSEMLSAWRSGEGDFFHEQGPYPHQLEHEGQSCIVASVGEALGPVAFSSLMCRWDWLQTDTARRFATAFRASRQWVNTAEPMSVARSLAAHFPEHPVEVLAAAIRDYQALGTWAGDIAIPPNLYAKALDVFEHAGLIHSRHRYEDVVSPPPDAI